MLSLSPGGQGGPPSPLSSHSPTSLFRSSNSRLHKSSFSKWRHSSTPYSIGGKRSRFTPRTANINPFDPTNPVLVGRRPARKRISWNLEGSLSRDQSSSEGSEPYVTDMEAINSDDIHPATSSEGETFVQMNTSITVQTDPSKSESRYVRDFEVVEYIGTGDTGSVTLCRHRLDGCFYAVKQSSKPVRGSYMEKRALREVWAHAVLGRHRRIVRYFSAWAEGQRMFIQNEFCAGGSLDRLVSELKIHNQRLPESAVKRIILHVSQGLKYIHSLKAAHMDIKPENIFLTKKIDVMDMNSSMFSNSTFLESSFDDGFCGDRDAAFDEDECDDYELLKDCVNFKIGDFGLVVKLVRDQDDPEPEEGDCRYLAPELLNDALQHDYTKCDIFSLGLTIIETVRMTTGLDDLSLISTPICPSSGPLIAIVCFFLIVFFLIVCSSHSCYSSPFP